MPQSISLSEYVHGDTWPGIVVGPITVNEAQPPVACAKVVMGFGKADTWPACAFLMSTEPGEEDGTITIDDANTWEFTVVAQQLTALEPGEWLWQMRFTDANGTQTTYFGGVFTVVANVPPVEAA